MRITDSIEIDIKDNITYVRVFNKLVPFLLKFMMFIDSDKRVIEIDFYLDISPAGHATQKLFIEELLKAGIDLKINWKNVWHDNQKS